jgi:hypothetical protein
MSSDAILSTKRAVLSSGGTRYNDLYYNVMNSSVSLLECTFEYNQIQSLPSLQFGSTSTINITNDQFIDTITLHCVLPAIVANQSIVRSWLARMVKSVAWTLGSSNSTQIYLQSDSIFQFLMGQCYSAEKRLEIGRLAGEEILAPQVPPAGEDTPLVEAFLVIPTPFSTLCNKLPLDTTMLQNNIQIQIQFENNPYAIYGGTGAVPTSFLTAEFIYRMGKLSDQSKSLRREMILSPSLQYAYPFTHAQSFTTPSFTGATFSSGRVVQLDLNTFANADLLAISLSVVANSDKSPTGLNTPNPWNYADIYNVRLEFAGQTLFQFPSKMYRLTNMLTGGQQESSAIPGSVVLAGTTQPFSSMPKDNYLIWFDFSRTRAICEMDHLYNTWRLTNQTLRLTFNTPLTDVQYTAYLTYFYNGVAELQNGTSSIYID